MGNLTYPLMEQKLTMDFYIRWTSGLVQFKLILYRNARAHFTQQNRDSSISRMNMQHIVGKTFIFTDIFRMALSSHW